MSNKLSHSSVNKFQECPKAWEYHYLKNLRSTTQSAALLFGTAIDKAVEHLVLNKNLDESKKIFYNLWEKQEINGILTELQSNPNIVYANSDLDKDLLPNTLDLEYRSTLDEIKNKKDSVGFDNLHEQDKVFYNQANWAVARKRGELMLEAVYEEIVPKIKNVLSTQEKINLSNATDDSVIGFVDLVAEFDDVRYQTPIIFDFKTSSREYEEDSVVTSQQLTLYVHALSEKYNTRKAGYIVLSKSIQKNKKKVCSKCNVDGTGSRHKTCPEEIDKVRCNGQWIETLNPKAKIQIIIDEIPEQLENIVLENMDDINKLIKNKVFIRNLNNCKKPWGLCDFYNLCHKNKTDGLMEKVNKNEMATIP